jgi:hypothetical protein
MLRANTVVAEPAEDGRAAEEPEAGRNRADRPRNTAVLLVSLQLRTAPIALGGDAITVPARRDMMSAIPPCGSNFRFVVGERSRI